MTVCINSRLIYTLFLAQFVSRSQCQITQKYNVGKYVCEESWPTNAVLLAMIDQLRDHFMGTNQALQDQRNVEVENLAVAFRNLKAENDNFKAINEQLATKVQNLSTTILKLVNTTNNLKRETQELNTTALQLDTLQKKVADLEDKATELKQKSNKRAYFTAYSRTSKTYCCAGNVVIMNIVISNFGGHFNVQTGKFTCPHSGVYIFSFTAAAPKNKHNDIEIWIDNFRLTGVCLQNLTGFNQVSTVAVARCRQGQKVWLKNTVNSYVYGSTGRHTSFTGSLLQAE